MFSQLEQLGKHPPQMSQKSRACPDILIYPQNSCDAHFNIELEVIYRAP
jgi:hypothetical protein